MRILLWVTLGFAASCSLGVCVLGSRIAVAAIGFGLALLAVLLLQYKKGHTLWRYLATLFAGLLLGSLWYWLFDSIYLLPLRQWDGETANLSITVTDYSYETDYGICADGKAKLNGKSYALRFYGDETLSLKPGDRVCGEYTLRYTAPGGKQEATHHSGSGTFVLAYPKGKQTVEVCEEIPWQFMPAQLRLRLQQLLTECIPEDASGFMRALLLGDTDGLDYKTNTDLSVSGIRHVAAVSGLHVSILMSVMYLLLGRNRFINLAVGLPLLLLFAAIAGFSPSVVRACIMQMLLLLAMAANQEYDPPTALAFSALTMLVWNPLVITSVGFQLSVSSVGGIFLFSGPLQGWFMDAKRFGRFQKRKKLHRFVNGFVTSVSISMGATVLTVPLAAWYFGTVSLLGVVTNLLCLWVITGIFCAGLASCAIGMVWMPAGKLLGWLVAWPVRYVLCIAGWIADIPFAAVYTESIYIVVWIAFCYLLLAVFWLGGRKRPVIWTFCAVFSLCLAMLASWVEPLMDNYRLTVLDVGQGQCILLQSGGRTYMVDCGGDRPEEAANLAAQTLLSQGITHLDGLIITHFDADHTAGASMLLQRIPTDLLILPRTESGEQRQNLPVPTETVCVPVEDQIQIAWESNLIRIFGGESGKNDNERSTCVLFHTEKCDILITGDRSISGELALMKEVLLPKLDVLIVGHHGSATSTGYALLRRTEPALAVISVGKDNNYGLPSEEVLKKLQTYGCRIRRTDLEGTIVIRE